MSVFDRFKKTKDEQTESLRAIGTEEIQKAQTILNDYKTGKANLDKRIIANEEWYKLHNWEQFDEKSKEQVKPTSAYLFNCIMNKHADCMDNYPRPTVQPREDGDQKLAKTLSSILPVILEQNDFEKTYSDVMTYKLTKGTGIYGIYWDSTKLNGLGDVEISKCDLLNLYWESGITNIQDSANVFYTTLVDLDVLKAMYPEHAEELTRTEMPSAKYEYDDTVDTKNKATVVDWYYKKNVNGKTILHFVKYCGNVVLYATENDTELKTDVVDGSVYTMAERGLYDHGKYPFILDTLFTVEGSPAGFGFIDVGKSAQEQIDRMNQYLIENMLANTKPRYFVRTDGNINEEEFKDITKDVVHFEGTLDDSVAPISSVGLSGNYISLLQNKIDELKETTGNRDVSNGGTTGGVTASSALNAMMEQASKSSRDATKQSYRAYREMILMIIELIRQFYDVTRVFRIIGEQGEIEFVKFNNLGLRGEAQNDFDVITHSKPIFDVSVSAEKQSPYTRLSQNEFILQLYASSFFAPQNSDQALAAASLMDFDGKDQVMQIIQQNGTMYDQIQQLQMIIQQMNADINMLKGVPNEPLPMPNREEQPTNDVPKLKTSNVGGEDKIAMKAKERVAESTTPR